MNVIYLNQLTMINYLFSKSKSKCFKRLGLLALLFMFTAGMYAQTTVTGQVTDEDGPLPGASVVIKGTNTGVTSDFDGNYSISVAADGVLVFSSLSSDTQEVAVNGQTQINVVLVTATNTLEEVVVIGYGSMERSNVTGAITTVNVDEIAKVPVPNAIEALRGQVAGLKISKSSGKPGDGVTFSIRGNNSLGADPDSVEGSNEPIIVIDGVPVIGGNLSYLNTDDIESMNVLKDAAASAIYGSSGANGVILITTKRGKVGRTEISVNASSGFVSLVNTVDPFSGDEFIKFKQDVVINGVPGATAPAVSNLLDGIELQNYIEGNETDWFDLVNRTGVQTNVGVTFSGGSEKFNFYLSGDMYDETGILIKSDYKRFSFRFNADMQATDWLKVGARVQMSKSFADQASDVIGIAGDGAAFGALLESSPWGNAYTYDDEGNVNGTTKYVNQDLFALNPLHKFNESIIDREVTIAYINPYLEIKIADGLTYTLNSYAEQNTGFVGEFRSSDYADDTPNYAQVRHQETSTYLFDNIIGYTKDFGKHSIDVTAVFGMQKWEQRGENGTADYLPTDILGYHSIGEAPQALQIYDFYTDEWAKVYQVGRLGYNFDSRFSATFTIRRDGSSKFGPNNKYGTFPSISGAWNMQNEKFWGDKGKFNQLKIRLSYGELGNDNIPTYLYRTGVNTVIIPPDGRTGFIKSTTGSNANLKWETSKQFNAGLDFGFFNNRLTGSFEIYKTNTTDLLLFQLIPAALNNGIDNFPSNIGETENKGIEVTLHGTIVDNEDFQWNASINYSTDDVQIVKLNQVDDTTGEPLDDVANGWFIGQNPFEIFDFKYEGVWQLDEIPEVTNFGEVPEPGDPKIADMNGDGDINFDDRSFLGNPTPDWYGSLSNTFSYKGLELSILIEVQEGVTRVNNLFGGYNSARSNKVAINYWTPDNPSNEYPRVGADGGYGGSFATAIRVQDASFVALRNVSLTYSLPQKTLENTPLTGVSFYARGNNLYYWTDYGPAYSPESSNTSTYPTTKVWSFGTTFKF